MGQLLAIATSLDKCKRVYDEGRMGEGGAEGQQTKGVCRAPIARRRLAAEGGKEMGESR